MEDLVDHEIEVGIEASLVVADPVNVLAQRTDGLLACGPVGSIVIFNASVWHGHSANKSNKPRRSIAAHFVPREAQASPDDPSQHTRPETLLRISDLAKYVLNVGTSNKPAKTHAP